MKFTYAALAAVGVSAHNHEHNWKAIAADIVYKPLFGGHIKDMCTETPEKLKLGIFIRKLLRATHVSGTEALYGESGFISDECFGDWIEPMWAPIHDAFHKMHEDFMSPTYDEWALAGKAWLDIAFRNN